MLCPESPHTVHFHTFLGGREGYRIQKLVRGMPSDSILVKMNLEIEVKTELSEETRMSSCNLMKVDGSGSIALWQFSPDGGREHMMAARNTRSSSDHDISKHVTIFDTYTLQFVL